MATKKDRTGNKASAHIMIGTSYKTCKTSKSREKHDFYATDPEAVRLLLNDLKLPKTYVIWECACGMGHLSEQMRKMGYIVYSTDLINRQYKNMNRTIDFLACDKLPILYTDAIITNPPYKYTNEFIKHSLALLPRGGVCAMFLNMNQLVGQKRYTEIYATQPPKYVYIFPKRVHCAQNGDFDSRSGDMINYAWFVWKKGYKGETILKWLNNI